MGYRNVENMGSLRETVNLVKILRAAAGLLSVLGLSAPALARGDHKQKVLVPVAPVYAMPTAGVAMAPVVPYPVGMVAGGAVGMAPVVGQSGGMYFAQTTVSGAQVSMAPTVVGGAPMAMSPTTYVVQGAANAPQVVTNGTANAPTVTSIFGNAPSKIGDSRVTDEGRRDVLQDLRDYYRGARTGEKSRTAMRKDLKEQAQQKYVEVIGDDVTSATDLNESENKEIAQIVDTVMREDPSYFGAAPSGAPYQAAYPYGGAVPAQPMMYYYAYPVAPAGHHHHLHPYRPYP